MKDSKDSLLTETQFVIGGDFPGWCWRIRCFLITCSDMDKQTCLTVNLSVSSARYSLHPSLQAVHVGPRLAGGRPELHEGSAVSFTTRRHLLPAAPVRCLGLMTRDIPPAVGRSPVPGGVTIGQRIW